MSWFTDVLVVSPLADGRTWVVRGKFRYEVGELGSGDVVDVPQGFRTDFASVPQPLWAVFPRWGKHGNAAVVHDWLYWEQRRSRKEADAIFHEGMLVLGTPRWKAWAMWAAVRTFGWMAWLRSYWRRRCGYVKIGPLPTKAAEMP